MIIWGELTCPLEENIAAAQKRKTTAYQSLADGIITKGWKAFPFTIEVGSIGFVATSFRYFLQRLGIPEGHLKCILKRVSMVALRSSFYIWAARESQWDPPCLVGEKFDFSQ